jgi:hypothetical protein
MAFVVIGAAGITGSAWLLVLGFAAHGLKDAWQQRAQYVSGTRWWPPFCAAVNCLIALAIGIEIVAGIASSPSGRRTENRQRPEPRGARCPLKDEWNDVDGERSAFTPS